MDKQKQIEEMAKVLHDGNAHKYADWVEYTNADLALALKLYNAGYRKIPEFAVMMTRERYEKLRSLADECLDWRRKNCNVGELPKENAVVLTEEEYERWQGQTLDIKKVRKETAEKFAERVKMAFYYEFDELIPSIMADKIDEICKELLEE